MKTVTQIEMLRILEEEDIAWMQRISHGGKTYLYMKTVIEGEADLIFRTEIQP